MTHTIRIVDAFTDRPFAGNPAAVCVLDAPADEAWMRNVAREMNISETAFLYPIEGGHRLRWLTPTVEVKLCGHATLASAFVLWETGALRPDEEACFQTLSGWLNCRRSGESIEMDFPATPASPCAAPDGLAEAVGVELRWVGRSDLDYLVEVADESILRALKPDLGFLGRLPVRGVIVTCAGRATGFDFLSRFFAPAAGVDEDPVTGSAHCTLGPYWKPRLGKADMVAHQASQRGGEVGLSVLGERVLLRGRAVMMSTVELYH